MTTTKTGWMPNLLLVGGGKMGAALAGGWLNAERLPLARLAVYDRRPSQALKDILRHDAAALNPDTTPQADWLVLAVKPHQLADVHVSLADGPQTGILSIMAGVTIGALETMFGPRSIVRAMPNTPGAVGAGITAYCMSQHCSIEDKNHIEDLLRPLGQVEGPVAEADMDAITAISGAGPAYVFALTEALGEAGRQLGLDADLAYRLSHASVSGAGRLLADDAHASDLRRAVASPGGATEAALAVLDNAKTGLRPVLIAATRAAAARAAELSPA